MGKQQLNVLFVCSGNICRSPYAAAMLARDLAALGIHEVTSESVGTLDMDSRGASRLARQLGAERGLDLSQHTSRQVDKRVLEDADIVVAMTPAHAVQLAEMLQGVGGKMIVWDIPDPYGLTEKSYRTAFSQMDEAMPALISEIKKKLGTKETT